MLEHNCKSLTHMLHEPNPTGKIVHMSYQLRVQDSLKRKRTNGNPYIQNNLVY